MTPSPSDHFEITQLLAKYCLALDSDDVESASELFAPDGVFEVYGRQWVGPTGVREMLNAAPRGLHLGGPPVLTMVDAGHAITKQNLLFVDRTDGSSRQTAYTDELVRTHAGWRFQHRRVRFFTRAGLADRPPRATPQRTLDPAEFAQLATAYAWYVDTADAAGLRAIFSPDMVFAVRDREIVGCDAVVEMLTHSIRGTHVASAPLVKPTEFGASGLSRFIFEPADGSGTRSGGYEDEFVLLNQHWVLARRTVSLSVAMDTMTT